MKLLFKLLILSMPLCAIFSREPVKFILAGFYLYLVDRYIVSRQESVIGSILIQPRKLNFYNLRKGIMK
jgi:hypothetical protein